jgi:putative spermidine/putrescine transport system substrate-binding protein
MREGECVRTNAFDMSPSEPTNPQPAKEDFMTELRFNRRQALAAGAAFAGSAALGRSASAQQQRVVVGTWGGDYSRLIQKNIDAPFLKSKGVEVVYDEAGDPPRRAKMTAEARLPRGTSDIQALSAAQMYEMEQAGLLLKLDYSQIPNAANLIPAMKYPYGVGHIYSAKVAVFNPKLTAAPKSFRDAFDPKHGNKMGIIDIQYQFVMLAAALANGGSVSNFEPGKEVLLAAKKAGARIYPTNEAFAAALKSDEIHTGIMWKARVVQWQNAGISVEAATPSEGAPFYISGFCIPKNAPNKAGAYAFLSAMLEKQAQENFAVDMGYNATVTTAVVSPELNKRIGFTPDEQKRLVDLDYGYIAKNDAAMKEWWDKVFKA